MLNLFAKKTKRWYESKPVTAQCVKMMETFPGDIQTIVSDGLIALSIRDHQADEVYSQLKSLGTEKVMALYKSHKKQRGYDQNTSMHKAMNYMLVLPETDQDQLARHGIELSNNVLSYLQTCKSCTHTPNLLEIQDLTQSYVVAGSQGAKLLLEQYHLRMKHNQPMGNLAPALETSRPEASRKDLGIHADTDSSMRLKVESD